MVRDRYDPKTNQPPIPVEDPHGSVELADELRQMREQAVEIAEPLIDSPVDDAILADIEREIDELMSTDLDDSSMNVAS